MGVKLSPRRGPKRFRKLLGPRQTRWGVLGLTLLAFALRVYALGRWELWFDETASYAIAVKSVPDLLAYTRSAIQEHPPGYYLLLHFWMKGAGSSEFALRFVSVLSGVLFIPLIFRFGRRLFSRDVGILAALVAAISPFAVSYAQEARMYTLLTLLALLSLYAFWMLLQEGRWRWWIAWVAAAVAGLLAHYLFGLLIIAQDVFVILLWRRLGQERKRWAALQAALALGALTWVVLAPGTIRSLLSVAGAPAYDLGYKIEKVLLDIALGELRGHPSPAMMRGAAAFAWVLVLAGLIAAWRRPLSAAPRRTLGLVGITLTVPFLTGLPVIPVVIGRYFSVAFPAFCLAVALALFALGRWRRAVAVLAIGGLAAVSAYGLFYQYTVDKGVFGQPIAFIESEYRPDEAMILVHPHLWPQATYYARNISLPRYYVPDKPYAVSEPEIRSALQAILDQVDSVWLGPVLPAHTDPETVERDLNDMAFQHEKRWFEHSVFAAQYFRSVPMHVADASAFVWGGAITLRRFEHSDLSLPAGDALRLRFSWQRSAPIQERYLVGITLTDGRGRVWASRTSEPCGAWCLTTDWGDEPVRDQHALLVPADTPPGDYDLRLAWYEQGTGQPLRATGEAGADAGTAVSLARVTVTEPPTTARPPRPPIPLLATFDNGLTLRGYDRTVGGVRPGDVVALDLYWDVARSPAQDASLELSLSERSGDRWTTVTDTLAAESYPPSAWPAGRAVRTHARLVVPATATAGPVPVRLALRAPDGSLIPGHWSQSVELPGRLWTWTRASGGDHLQLFTLTVTERERNFTLPTLANPITATLGSQVELVGYDMPCLAAQSCAVRAGDPLDLTLAWRAKGPTDRRYKVFAHLVGPDGKLWGQHDAEPAGGSAPTITWAAGEFVSDTHVIHLMPEAPPGDYRLLVGMYHEASGQRLPAFLDGKRMPNDALPLAEVHVER